MRLKRRDLLGLGISTAALAACGKLANSPSNTSSNATPVAAKTETSSAKLRLGFQPPYVAVYALREQKLLEKNPETIQKFLQAYKQAISWAKDNRQAAVDILVKENKLSPQAADLTLGRRNLIFEVPNDEYRQELINQSQLLTRLGLIKQQPNWDSAIDTTVAKAIAS
ncbi:hypothetical protein H6G27_34715 [Nostoc linckia FACHB-104]|nr:hypothetical protein [Nostoc linckia FACHB-104]